MIKECMEVFKEELAKKGPKLILDTYIPADGTYLIVTKTGEIKESVEIKLDKEKNEVSQSNPSFNDICFYDYHSRLISMNKPMDAKKIIHSNNYLSFWVKKDSIVSGKLTEEIIDGYYDVLIDPLEKKYKKSKEASKIYSIFEISEGKTDREEIENKKQWIKDHIFSLENVDMGRKDYLKIFFEADKKIYEREGRRYFLPNIYNSNDYNVEVENRVRGLPDNNLGMNAKKPFLSIKTRKCPAPYLLDGDEVMLQKQFFDYLMNLASARKYNIYIDTDLKMIRGYPNGQAPASMESGYYLRIQKGKNEAEIQKQDNIVNYRQQMEVPLAFQEIIGTEYKMHPDYAESYGSYSNRVKVGQLINEVFFSNYLSGNYSIDASEINMNDGILKQGVIEARDAVFDWVFKGIDRNFEKILNRVSFQLIKGNLLKGYRERALWQLDLRYSFKQYFNKEGEIHMAEIISGLRENLKKKVLSDCTIPLESDEEYFYAVGQLAAFLLSLNKGKDKNQALLNPFLNARTDEMIKIKLLQLYKKYNYAILDNSKRAKNLMAMVEGYAPEGKVDQEKIVLGYACDNLVYLKEEK